MPPFVLRLCQAVQSRGWQSLVLAPHAEGLATHEKIEGVACHRFHYAPPKLEQLAYGGGMLGNVKQAPWRWLLLPLYLLALMFSIYRSQRRHRGALIHAHWIVPQGFAAAVLKKVLWWRHLRLVITVHGSDMDPGATGLLKRITVWSACQADVLTVVSHAIRADAIRLGIPAEKIVVAPMGVDIDLFCPPEHGVVRKGVLFVGRLAPEKGLEFLLRAFSLLVQSVPDVTLTVVGDGPSRPMLERLADELKIRDQVSFVGSKLQREIPALMQTHKMLVLSSVREGLGLVVAEAMACGCPVVAHDLPGVRDLVKHKETGLLVRLGDPLAMAEAMASTLAVPSGSNVMVENALNHVAAEFGWSAVARKYADIYDSMMKMT